MNRALVEKVVSAVLYEGLILYPYRPTSKKNRQRFTFGRVYPRAHSEAEQGREPCVMQTECLARAPEVRVSVRFLQPMAREIARLRAPLPTDGREPAAEIVPELTHAGRLYQTWHEALERTIELPPPATGPHSFHFPATRAWEPIPGAEAIILRHTAEIAGTIELTSTPLPEGLTRLRVRIVNESPLPPEAASEDALLLRTMASTHTILQAVNGEFLSLLDPPPAHAAEAAACQQIGTWPVLVGDAKAGERDTLLSSPIILYDYPQIAPESAGELFDGTEIDEILTLRVLTMTDGEKAEMRDLDPRARAILERTENLSSGQMLEMHGTLRDVRTAAEEFFNAPAPAEAVTVRGIAVQRGDRVRIHPKGRADAMDIVLAGKVGIIEAIERDVEDRLHFALVMEDDPGRELGLARFPGHRFFYSAEEIEPLPQDV